MHRRPMFFSTLRWKLQQEMAATFLAKFFDLRGRNCGLFIHLVQLCEEGKPEKKAGSTSLERFWLGVVGQRNQKKHAKNNHKKHETFTKMVPKLTKK